MEARATDRSARTPDVPGGLTAGGGGKGRLWARAAAASAGLHVLALMALELAPKGSLDPRSGLPPTPALTVDLVRLPGRAERGSVDAPSTTPTPLSVGASPSSPPQDQASGSASDGSGSGDDGLYRVPFRDAVGQAFASLRGGLGCAHVELSKLPGPVRALCDAASKPRATVEAARAKAEDHGAVVETKWAVQRSAAAGLGLDCARPDAAGHAPNAGGRLHIPVPASLCEREPQAQPPAQAANLRLNPLP